MKILFSGLPSGQVVAVHGHDLMGFLGNPTFQLFSAFYLNFADGLGIWVTRSWPFSMGACALGRRQHRQAIGAAVTAEEGEDINGSEEFVLDARPNRDPF